ncbi:protein MKS1-like [Zingiber officinale]|uniref:protein MKS1-like n=1 Tax=Zingiber officinale TaxID=94328 RepID=UPI001C4CF34C|nr:protein MKS1-like [Zingiber officinale]
MEPSDCFLAPPSRRRKIKGLRQTPIDVRHDSHNIIKKHPPAPAPRQPVIIYTVSPEVIHVDRSEFMSLVQRLTGAPSSSSDTNSVLSSSSSFSDHHGGGSEGLDQPGIDAAMRTAAGG